MEYLVFGMVFLPIWGFLFCIRPDLRRLQLFGSVLFAPFGYLGDLLIIPWYWDPGTILSPLLGIESILLAFLLGGIASAVYPAIFGRTPTLCSPAHANNQRRFLVFAACLLFSIFIFDEFVDVSFLYNATYTAFLGGLLIMWFRKDLAGAMVLGGGAFTMIYVACLFLTSELMFDGWIGNVWTTEHLWGIYLLKIPLEEFLWALSMGILWSGIFGFIEDQGFQKVNRAAIPGHSAVWVDASANSNSNTKLERPICSDRK